MTTRQEKIARAREIITAQPESGRRKIAEVLRQEFGSGLRDSAILSIQQTLVPQRGHVDPFLFVRRDRRRLTEPRAVKEQSTRNKLARANFTQAEIEEFMGLSVTSINPIIRQAKKDRKELLATTRPLEGLSKRDTLTELMAIVSNEYEEKGWQDRAGDDNPWTMLREARRKAIEAGEWDPEKDSPSRKKRGKAKLARKRVRYRKLNRDVIAEKKKIYREDNRERINKRERDRRQKVRLEKKPGTK